jgi:uncharacterized membrane protein
MRRFIFKTAVSLSAVVTVLALPGLAQAQSYQFLKIGADPAPQYLNSARAINDAGFVAGGIWSGNACYAYVWSLSGGLKLQKQVKGQNYGSAYALNDHLQVGGSSGKISGAFGVTAAHATAWLSGDPVVVGDTKNPNSYVYGMNNAGWMVGWQAGSVNACLFRIVNGRVSRTALGFSFARDINNHGVVVGEEYNLKRAVRWTASTGVQYIPGMMSAAAINDLGWIVGSQDASVQIGSGTFSLTNAAIHIDGVTYAIEMPEFEGGFYYRAYASAISESGRFVVGKVRVFNEVRQPIFEDGFLHDRQTGGTHYLTHLVPGQTYYEVNGVNSSGHIVGSTQNPNGSYSAFILLRQN